MPHDLIICGAGPAGCAAAVTAARQGLRVCLVERYGFAGGMATSGLVNPWLGHELRQPSSEQTLFLGSPFFAGIVRDLHARGAYGSRLTQSAFDEEQLRILLDERLLESSVEVLFHSQVVGVRRDASRIVGVDVSSKAGTHGLQAGLFIDATGDGDVAAMAGCDHATGRPSDGLCQPMTTSFRMGNVDKRELHDQVSLRAARALVGAYFQRARDEGRLDYPARDFVHFYDYPRPGVLHFNMTRINRADGLDAAGLTRAEMEGRRQVKTLSDWLVAEVPCFRNAFLMKLPTQVGVRETRHFVGRYTMADEDVTRAAKFSDGIARSAYFIDIHSPTGPGFDHSRPGSKAQVMGAFAPPKGDHYEIPFRTMQLPGVNNLLLACRALSASHAAAAAVRVMATMTATGEAAGVAAALARGTRDSFADVDGGEVRRRLGYLDEPPVVLELEEAVPGHREP